MNPKGEESVSISTDDRFEPRPEEDVDIGECVEADDDADGLDKDMEASRGAD